MERIEQIQNMILPSEFAENELRIYSIFLMNTTGMYLIKRGKAKALNPFKAVPLQAFMQPLMPISSGGRTENSLMHIL